MRYADLFSDEEQGSTARSLEPPARVEEAKAANVVTMPTRYAIQ